MTFPAIFATATVIAAIAIVVVAVLAFFTADNFSDLED